jgi:hypothetical protein
MKTQKVSAGLLGMKFMRRKEEAEKREKVGPKAPCKLGQLSYLVAAAQGGGGAAGRSALGGQGGHTAWAWSIGAALLSYALTRDSMIA